MDSNTKVNICLVLSVIAVILGSMAVYMSMTDDGEGSGTDLSDKTTVYFGLDPDATQEEMAAVEEAVRKYVFDSGNGYTMYWAEGGYVSDSGSVSGQHTLVVMVTFADREYGMELGKTIIAQFGLDTALVESTKLGAELVFLEGA